MDNAMRVYLTIYPYLEGISSLTLSKAPCKTAVTAGAGEMSCRTDSFRRVSIPTGRVAVKFNRHINNERGRVDHPRLLRSSAENERPTPAVETVLAVRNPLSEQGGPNGAVRAETTSD